MSAYTKEASAQAAYWADPATGARLIVDSTGPSQFVTEVAPHIHPGAVVADLGCGAGYDTAVLAAAAGESGLVLACDVNTDLLGQAVARATTPGSAPVQPMHADLGRATPLGPASVDVAYAHLSLHYFDDTRTRQVFAEIRTALRPGGLFAVACKSTRDPSYGKGTQIGHRIFSDGPHLRHFFDAGYLTELLADFEILTLAEEYRDLYGYPAAVVTALARA